MKKCLLLIYFASLLMACKSDVDTPKRRADEQMKRDKARREQQIEQQDEIRREQNK